LPLPPGSFPFGPKLLPAGAHGQHPEGWDPHGAGLVARCTARRLLAAWARGTTLWNQRL